MNHSDTKSPLGKLLPAHWLSEQAKTGLRELPANASWLIQQARHP